MAYLYTKGGDKGTTGLFGGSRVSKTSLQVDCYGTVDEANAALGLAYAASGQEMVRAYVRGIQNRLFLLAAELASDEKGAASLQNPIGDADVQALEQMIDSCTDITGKLDAFVIPGDSEASAVLHMARTVVRRAERGILLLNEAQGVREVLLRYVNRLSDAVFALALLQAKLDDEAALRQKVTRLVRQKMEEYGMADKNFTLEKVSAMAARGVQKAEEIGVPMVIAFVDEGGNLQLLHRMEDALLASIDVAAGKAYTACALKMPTDVLAGLAQPGQPLFGIEATNEGKIVIFGGGHPLVADDRVVGGIGVSGGSVEEDMQVMRAALGEG